MVHRLNFGGRSRLLSRHSERGQTVIIVVIALSLFLLGFIGLAVDYSNLWFHRQAAQGAADAACQAGAMDMYQLEVIGATPGAGNFNPGFTPTIGSEVNCSASSNPVPCKYAALNGFDGGGLTTGAASNEVKFSFPSSITGVSPPPGTEAPVPFMRVDITDRVRVFLAALISGQRTQDVVVTAKCGLVSDQSPIPLIILHPHAEDSLTVQGDPTISIVGGPKKSIQVNSDGELFTTTAVTIGGSAGINLTQGGPNYNGSSFGTYGTPSSPPAGFTTAGNGRWVQPSHPIKDPYEDLAVPNPAALTPQSGPIATPGYGVAGCPDPAGCDEYAGGYYSGNIWVKNKTAIFDPGIYYVDGGLKLDTNSLVRPSTAAGDGSGGTFFYLAGPTVTCSGQSGLVCSGSNSGKTTVDDFPRASILCPGQSLNPTLAAEIPTSLNGNLLLAPCSGTYGGGGSDRGVLFFGNRESNGGAGWGGGGGYLLAGTIYIHQCRSADGAGLGTNCNETTGYNSHFQLLGGSGSGSYVLGEIIADTLTLGGTSDILMALNPNRTFPVIKVSLLQ
jgi:hypothetical protein